ncbi:hypothetical protein [Pseudaminobacter sp. NGMCC 1.201702]|uniref:hypothetical protein n=1 Tax=Pseudaminobacter sp. NGMCC 1.201702 TaxID=3391825 RepID=UPI0039EFA5C6
MEKETGKKAPFSFCHFIPYVLVPERSMIDEASPIASRRGTLGTLEKNVFRFLPTGRDDSAVVAVASRETLQAANAGKTELLREMLEGVEKELSAVDSVEGIPRKWSGWRRPSPSTERQSVRGRRSWTSS